MTVSGLKETSAKITDELVDFLQRLVQIPSITGQEQAVATLIANQMKRLTYDEVFTDPMGNVVGIIKGSGKGNNIMLNGHMDHVDPGRLELWQHDPYGGIIEDGYLYGRGACDMKGGLASHVFAAAIIKNFGFEHKGDIIVTAVVQEELCVHSGIGYLCDVALAERGIKVDFVAVGEPSNLKLMLGHKGRLELELTTAGRTSHGSAPWHGINAVYKMLPVISEIQAMDLNLPRNKMFGKSTLSLTNISCHPDGTNIIPDICTIHLDGRLIPGETDEAILSQIETILKNLEQGDPDFKGTVRVPQVNTVSYTGLNRTGRKAMPSWQISPDHFMVSQVRNALRDLESGEPEIGYWGFATDGSYTAAVLGIPTVGYGPGEEHLAHTPHECISLKSLIDSVPGNAAIALAITG